MIHAYSVPVLNEIFSPAFNILEVSSGEECLQMIKDKKI